MMRSIQTLRAEKILMFLYCLCMNGYILTIVLLYYLSSSRIRDAQRIRNSPYIPEEFKGYCSFLLDMWYGSTVILHSNIWISFIGYYSFVCHFMKIILNEFASYSQMLIKRREYHTVLEVYREITQVMIFADNFLSFTALANLISVMTGLFWTGYSLVFFTNGNYMYYLRYLSAVVYVLTFLLMMMLPATAENVAAKFAKGIVLSLPGSFPEEYKKLMMYIHKNFKYQELELTLWKIYKIDKSLLISEIGTVITYGILVGTLGSVQNSRDNNVTSINTENNHNGTCTC
ncbi:uncharacterized protein NPIL_692621 [Nephila pilipes]|uniref:Uncharacterized protein n=1 Tax=Nephila pilipes TaxID=299642 RepID=A0A8X6MP59_NEPPI|nr:uncharacterized protein NPIL_692621 [Nephila pilipes]